MNKMYCLIVSVLFVLFTFGCNARLGSAPKTAAAEPTEQVSADPNMGDKRLIDELSRLRMENEQLKLAQGGAGDKPSLVPGVGNSAQPSGRSPSVTIVDPGAQTVRYDPLFSPAIPSRTVYLPGEKRYFVSFEGLGGWAICQGTQNAWGPVNLDGRMVPALRSEMSGCIVATDCPSWDPDGMCRKELTIVWLERSNPSHVVNRKTVMVKMQRCAQCKSIGLSCMQRGPAPVCI